MYGKLLFAAGVGVGYLVGTSRGRKDYEALKLKVSELWLDPRVQKVAKQATDVVEENVPMGEKLSEARTAATKAAQANVGTPSSSGSSSSNSSAPGAASGTSASAAS